MVQISLSRDALRMFVRNKRLSSLPIYEQIRIKNMIEYWTPKDRAEWNAFMIKLVKKKTCVKFLSDQALLNVIQAARHTIWKQFSRQPEPYDPDVPMCYYWNETDCAEWIAANGFPEMKEAFLINHITGNKLIALDACAIAKMGVRYFDTIKAITAKIRELLNIPSPNMMRALMRIPPMETFLHKKIYKGRTYDLLTFEKFCENECYPYEFLTKTDTNARIPPTCKLMIHLFPELISDSGSSSDSNSLADVPTVEFFTRHVLMRNRIIQDIIDFLVDVVFTPELRNRFDALVKDSLRKFLDMGWKELGYDEDLYGKERIQFAVDVSKGLITEMIRTAQVLRDIQTTRKQIQTDITTQTYNDMKAATEILLETVLPVAALLASGELDLESIFRQEPDFNYFVDDIVHEAEQITGEVIPKTENFIDEVLTEAKLKIVSTLFPEIPIETIRSANELIENLLDDLIQEGITDYEELQEKDTNFENIKLEIDDDIEDIMGGLQSIPFERRGSHRVKAQAEKTYSHAEKFDPASGMPILDRLTNTELDGIITSGKITTKDGRKVSNKEILNKAASEKKHRESVAKRLSTEQPVSSFVPQPIFSHAEKFESASGMPILDRLTDDELENILLSGKIETVDGRKITNPGVLNKAMSEKKRRESIPKHPAEAKSSIHEEKFDTDGVPILHQLPEIELENILRTGTLETKDGRSLNVSPALADKIRVEAERRRKNSKSISRVGPPQLHAIKFPGKYTPEGTFQEYTREDKFDDHGMPIFVRLTVEELGKILATGSIETKEGKRMSASTTLLIQAREESNRRASDIEEALQQKNPRKYTTTGGFEEFTLEEKFDKLGMPILDRITREELETILKTGKIVAKDGKQVSTNDLVIQQAKVEINKRKRMSNPELQEQNPGKYTPEGVFQEFTHAEKFDEKGMPIIDRLAAEELDAILSTEKILTKDGKKVSSTSHAKLLQQAKAERSRRESVSTSKSRKPGKSAAVGVLKEFTQEEKFDYEGLPILNRFTAEELDKLLATGVIETKEGERVKANPEVLSEARAEMSQRRKNMKSASENILQNVYKLKNPGNYTSEGVYQPFTPEEKLDTVGLPILDRLTEEQLDRIIFTGIMEGGEQGETENAELVEKATAEKKRRIDSISLAQKSMQEYEFHRNYPGEYDSQGVYREFNIKEKFDSTTDLPILERLNHKELDQVINTGIMHSSKGPVKISEDILALARVERRRRERRESLAVMQMESYKRKYPGKIDISGNFTEFSLQEKLDRGGKPIVERLNMTELEKLLESKMFYGTTFDIDEVLNRARSELDRRKEEEKIAKIRIQISRKKYPGKVVDGEFQEYSFQEKFDSTGFPIFGNLNTEELEEIIKSGEVPTIDGISTTNEKLLEAARKEKQNRLDLEAYVKAEEKKNRKKLSETPDFSPEEKYDSTGQPIFGRLTDEDLEEVTKDPYGSSNTDEQVRAIQEQERRLEQKKQAKKTAESEALQNYRKKFPRSKSEGSVPSKVRLKDIVSKDAHLDKLTPEQRRLETLDAIKHLVSKKHEQNETKATIPKTVTSNANLALFNGFVIDDFANVIGTADPFDGKVKDKTGRVLGVITSQGMVFTQDGVALGRIGADVEQIGVGKFRALPKDIDSPEESTTDVTKDAPKTVKRIARWNTAQAEIKGGVLIKKGNQWLREAAPPKADPSQKTEIALQIQQAEGYSPEQVIILEDEPSTTGEPSKAGKTKQGEKSLGGSSKARKSESDKSIVGSEEVNKLIAKEFEKSEARKASIRAKTLGAAQKEFEGSKGVGGSIKGEETLLHRVDKKNLIAVPVPVSGKWGVQTPPSNELEPHEFKPPAPLSKTNRPSQPETGTKGGPVASSSQDMMTKVKTGEAKKLVAADGTMVGEIRKDGKIVNAKGESVGRVEPDGRIVNEDGSAMPERGLKVIRPNGVVVGHVSEKGKLSPDSEKERLLIGRIWGDGRIVTMDNALVGIVTKDGRILGPGGKPIGLFTPGWELLGTDGVPFAYVSSDGKVYRYEVIPQKKFEPPQPKTITKTEEPIEVIKPEKSEAIIIFHKKRSLDFAFELPPAPAKDVPVDFKVSEQKYTFEEVQPQSNYGEDMEALARKKAEKERMKRDEEMRKQYDMDESHKKAAPKTEPDALKDSEVGVGTQTSAVDTATALDAVSSETDHRVAKTSQEYLKQKQLHRKQLIENWANEVSDLVEPDYFSIDPTLSSEERSRIARMAADAILDDIFKLALTRLLLQAEAGDDTQRIMGALAAIQTTGEGQALWLSHARDDRRKSKMILKNMISFLPKPGGKRMLSSDDDNQRTSQDPATADAGVNTDAEKGKERRHRHRHRRHRKSNAFDITAGKDEEEAQLVEKQSKRPQRVVKKESKAAPEIKGRFSRIINPDEIEQFNQVFDNTGGRLIPEINQPDAGQLRRKEPGNRGKGIPLQHIPHPGVVDKGGKTVSAREDVAEQIHHGKQILADKELPIRPQNLPQRRSMR